MSCLICKRSSCIKSFHSIGDQERYEKKQEMSDDIDILRDRALELEAQIEEIECENRDKAAERDLNT